MSTSAFTHFVFVDFENVPDVDLALMRGLPVHISLLVGRNQKKLDTSFSFQMHEYADQVRPIAVGAAGPNALDLTLAYYLGATAKDRRESQFYIVSKDKDFDALVGHLLSQKVSISRHDAIATLPFLTRSTKKSLSKAPFPNKPAISAKPTGPTKSSTSAKDCSPAERLERLIIQLQSGPGPNRPKKRATLVHHIASFHANTLTSDQVEKIVAALEKRGVIRIDAKGKVSYSMASVRPES